MKYRKEIDGLRAVAVLPVIFFHADFSIFSGGYVGVDVFFVISGYLITCILLNEIGSGGFSIARFYERRARRILPALTVVLLVVLPFAYIWMTPSQLKDFSASLVSTTFSISNLYFLTQVDYFKPNAELHPLLHTWSLAIEEQYYFLFPLILLGLKKFRRSANAVAILILTMVSFSFSEWGWRANETRSFFFTLSRFWEIGVGSICAFISVRREQESSNLLSAVGLMAILASVFLFDNRYPSPSAYTLLPVLSAGLIILFAGEQTWVARLLSMRAFVGIGLISYSAYLWHQPLFAFARLRSLTNPDPALMAALSCISLLLAWITWRFIEIPFRRRTNPIMPLRGNLFVMCASVGVFFVFLGLTGYYTNGLEVRFSADSPVLKLDERIAGNLGLGEICEGKFDQEVCSTSPDPRVVLWGDSYAMHLAQGALGDTRDVKLYQHTMSACSPVIGIAAIQPGYNRAWAESCIEANDHAILYLQEHSNIELVILSSPFSQLLDGSVMLEGGEIIESVSMDLIGGKIMETVRRIRETGARVVIVSPTPRSGWDTGRCLALSVFLEKDESSCDFALDLQNPAFQLLEGIEDQVAIYWLHNDICKYNVCDAMQEGVFIFRDAGHLSKEGSAYLGRKHHWLESFKRIAN